MKRVAALGSAAVLTLSATFAGSAVVPGQASADTGASSTAAQMCRQNNNLGLGYAACVSFVQSAGYTGADFASLCRNNGNFGLSNTGDCAKMFNEAYR